MSAAVDGVDGAWRVFDKRYNAGSDLADHLTFALRHEAIDLLASLSLPTATSTRRPSPPQAASHHHLVADAAPVDAEATLGLCRAYDRTVFPGFRHH